MSSLKGHNGGDICYYTVLQVEHRASAEEIRQAYKKLARRYHPDRRIRESSANPQENLLVEVENEFNAVARAYEILSDPTQREAYNLLKGISYGAKVSAKPSFMMIRTIIMLD